MGKLFKLALEEAVETQPEVVQDIPVDELVNNAEELAKTDAEIQQDVQAVEDLMEEKAVLEEQVEKNEELLSNPDAVVSTVDVEVSEECRDKVHYFLGYDSSIGKIRLSSESMYDDVKSNPRKYLAISNEDIKETIKKIWEKIKAFFKKIWDKVTQKNILTKKQMEANRTSTSGVDTDKVVDKLKNISQEDKEIIECIKNNLGLCIILSKCAGYSPLDSLLTSQYYIELIQKMIKIADNISKLYVVDKLGFNENMLGEVFKELRSNYGLSLLNRGSDKVISAISQKSNNLHIARQSAKEEIINLINKSHARVIPVDINTLTIEQEYIWGVSKTGVLVNFIIKYKDMVIPYFYKDWVHVGEVSDDDCLNALKELKHYGKNLLPMCNSATTKVYERVWNEFTKLEKIMKNAASINSARGDISIDEKSGNMSLSAWSRLSTLYCANSPIIHVPWTIKNVTDSLYYIIKKLGA